MQVHVVQVAYGDDETPAARVARVADLVRAQAGADLVVLPELWPDGGFAYDAWAAGAQGLDGTVVTSLRAAAAELGATVHMGSFVERDEAGRMFNTSVLIGPTGALLATYRKIHLFGFGAGEPALMTAGDGTRRIVFGEVPNRSYGHFFNVVNDGGVVRYLDGQPGAMTSPAGYSRLWLLPTN